MEIRAIAKSVRVSPRKVRIVADAIRHLSLEEAMHALQATPRRAAGPLEKTLKSAAANAVNNANLELKSLKIATIMVNEGAALKRFRPSTRGRVHPYKKKSSNITVVLQSVAAQPAVSAKAQKGKSEEAKETEKKGAKK